MSQTWNLLHYPALHQQRRRRQRALTALLGLAVGALLAAATLNWLEGASRLLRMQQAQLQAQWLQVSQQLQHEQQQVAARDAQRQQALFLQQITQQHQAWAALHGFVLSQVPHGSWRLSRLQLESGQLELGGWSRDFAHLNATRQQLTTHLQSQLPAHWPAHQAPVDLVRQTSVVSQDAPGHVDAKNAVGLEFAWTSRWPVLQAPGQTPQKPASGDKP